jgi:hypothetical protein
VAEFAVSVVLTAAAAAAAVVSCHLWLELKQAGSPVHPGPL